MKTAFIFPGQGSQRVGMLSELAEKYSVVQQTFAEASEVLQEDLWHLVQQGPAEKLNQTAWTQPALLTASVAIWRVWQLERGQNPVVMAGHSLGEYSALVCADALDFSVAVKLVAQRGQYMQEAVPEGQGGMAAVIGLSEERLKAICDQTAEGKVLSLANYNSHEQIVIAGDAGAVDRAVVLARDAGARLAKRILVSTPSHCALMMPAAERLAAALRGIVMRETSIDVVNNVDAVIENQPDRIIEALIRQLYSPVRWAASIQLIEKLQVDRIIECGPGNVLAGLNKRMTDVPTVSVNNPESLFQALAC